MRFDGYPLEAAIDDHIYFSKEASSGGAGFAGRRLRVQLNGNGVRLALAAATGVLLGGADARAADWKFDSEVLYYSETDRVTAIEPVVSARWDRGDGKALQFQAHGRLPDRRLGERRRTLDPSRRPTPRRRVTTPTPWAPAETPLDPTFLDTRWALDLGWETPLSAALAGDLRSQRLDRVRLRLGRRQRRRWRGTSISATRTLSFGVSVGYDQINPVGGVPRPLAAMSPEVPDERRPLNRLGGLGLQVGLRPAGRPHAGDRPAVARPDQLQPGQERRLPDRSVQAGERGRRAPGADQGEPVATALRSRGPTAAPSRVSTWPTSDGPRERRASTSSYRYPLGRLAGALAHRRPALPLGSRGGAICSRTLRYYPQSAADFYARFLAGRRTAARARQRRLPARRADRLDVRHQVRATAARTSANGTSSSSTTGRAATQPRGPPDALAGLDLFPSVEAVMVQVGCNF